MLNPTAPSTKHIHTSVITHSLALGGRKNNSLHQQPHLISMVTTFHLFVLCQFSPVLRKNSTKKKRWIQTINPCKGSCIGQLTIANLRKIQKVSPLHSPTHSTCLYNFVTHNCICKFTWHLQKSKHFCAK